jgi:uncharacterized LabA/DUF88 family protein
MATVLFIDGENFKGKIKSVFYDAKKEKPIWHEYNFKGLLDKVLKDIPIAHKVFYFARVKEHPESKEKSLELIEEQRLLKTHLEKNGFEVILSGRVRGQMEQVGGKRVLVFKEKGVDVKIAVDMVVTACDKVASEIILASSDSDLQPAIKETIQRGVNCIYLGFESQPNKGISYTTSRTILIRNSEVVEFEKEKSGLPHFKIAKEKISAIVAVSLTKEDPGHSENAWKWLLKLKPDADEVLQLSVLGHDIERALPDRLTRDSFATYDEYKSAHAKRAGTLVARIARESGYSDEEAEKIERLIGEAEFSSNDPEVQLISDADSISFFDYNIRFYLERSGEEKAMQKMRFMYDRVSGLAKKEIDNILKENPNLARLLKEAHL